MTKRRITIEDLTWIDEFLETGHEILPDNTVALYHGTTMPKALRILAEGVLRRPKDAPDRYGVYFSTSPQVAEEYGDGTLVKVRVPVTDLNYEDYFPSGRMDFRAETKRGIYRPIEIEIYAPDVAPEDPKAPNPWLAEGWVLPNGTYVPLEARVDHKTLAAWIMRERDKGRAFRRALKERWVRVGSVTVQLPSPPDNDALLRAVEHVRETSPRVAWDIRIEWWKGNKITSYRVPILEFMELESLGDLRRYPKEEW